MSSQCHSMLWSSQCHSMCSLECHFKSWPFQTESITQVASTFCTGFMVHFNAVAISLLWFIHLTYLAILFKFPFFGKRMMKKAGLIHAVSVPTALLVCLIGPTITLWWCGYFTARFPNWVCLPSNLDMLFYTIALPLNIFLGVGITITLATLWEIHKVCDGHGTMAMAWSDVSFLMLHTQAHLHVCTRMHTHTPFISSI